MEKKEEAEQKWRNYILKKAGYINPCLSARETLSDFKLSLKVEIKKEIEKDDSDPYYNGLRKVLSLIDEVKPLDK